MYCMGMAKGLMVTLKNLTKRPFTVQYPEERLKQHPLAPSIARWGLSRLSPTPAGPPWRKVTNTGWKSLTSS